MPFTFNDYLKEKVEEIRDQRELKIREQEKYLFYNGAISGILEKNIRQQFSRSETIMEILARLIPINIMNKIINKLANTYIQAPVRSSIGEIEKDLELILMYEDSMNINTVMLNADREFERQGKFLLEPFVDQKGIPRARVLPAHTYYAFSNSRVTPNMPSSIWKVLYWDIDPSKTIYSVWTKDRHVITDGAGNINRAKMLSLGNEDGINPYGVIPFTYYTSNALDIEPIPQDDLLEISIKVPILLSDLCVANKFQSYAMIWTVDFDGDLPWGPGMVVKTQRDQEGNEPIINQVRPEYDVDGTLRLIESLISYLLSTKNLKSDTITGKLDVNSAASGIAKVIDNAELAIQNISKQPMYMNIERNFWNLIKTMQPVWKKQGILHQDFNQEFSNEFEIVVHFSQPQITLTEREKIELAKMKLDAGLTTLERELKMLNPNMDNDDIEALANEIREQRGAANAQRFKQISEEMNGSEG